MADPGCQFPKCPAGSHSKTLERIHDRIDELIKDLGVKTKSDYIKGLTTGVAFTIGILGGVFGLIKMLR